MSEGVYGAPPPALGVAARGAVQLSPLVSGAAWIDDLPDSAFSRLLVHAPPGTLERRFVLAHALRLLRTGGGLVALAPKALGGARLRGELEALGCAVSERAKRHFRICACDRPPSPVGLTEAIAAGGLQKPERLGLWSRPGVFSWDRPDPGTRLLLSTQPAFSGRGADLGCGVGVLALAALQSPLVTALLLIDHDARAIDAARRNVVDPRAVFLWSDARDPDPQAAGLDFVVMNPPFHEAGRENLGLGRTFIERAAAMLRPGGVCRLVANAALPYAARVEALFRSSRVLAHAGGYKVYEGVR